MRPAPVFLNALDWRRLGRAGRDRPGTSALRNLAFTMRTLCTHPLTRRGKLAALKRWLGWQVGSRLAPGPVVVPLVNDARLLVRPGMYGATLNLYVGLAEFADMAFALHFLRRDDVFADVGANVGVYTVLASGVVGCRTRAFEPTPDAFEALRENVHLNDIADEVQCHAAAVGSRSGSIRFTRSLDTLNHITPDGNLEGSMEVPLITLDGAFEGEAPTMLKIDVEGYEYPALAGAGRILESTRLQGILVEINPGATKYGYTSDQVFERIREHSFTPCTYRPFERELRPITKREWKLAEGPNTLFVRDLDEAAKRVFSAPPFHVLGREI